MRLVLASWALILLPAAVTGEECSAVFRWLQKDAYAERPGRGAHGWPPHTTTVVEVFCTAEGKRERIERKIMSNHGTSPDETDAEGRRLLAEVQRDTRRGSREELLALASEMSRCECGTGFLRLEVVREGSEREILDAVSAFAEENLECGGRRKLETVLGALRAVDAQRVVEGLEACEWRNESGMEGAFDQALLTVEGSLEDYHVCNNDARIQAEIWSRFEPGAPLPACPADSELCRGPLWLYDP